MLEQERAEGLGQVAGLSELAAQVVKARFESHNRQWLEQQPEPARTRRTPAAASPAKQRYHFETEDAEADEAQDAEIKKLIMSGSKRWLR